MKVRGIVPLSFLLPTWLHLPWLTIGVAKEVREILPYWLLSLLTSVAWLSGLPSTWDELGWLIFLAGELATVAMGAALFGHEFAHGTMPLLLVQPWSRSQLWRRKMKVLCAAMATVFLVRLAGPVLHGAGWSAVSFAGLMSVAAILSGLTVAPALTLWSRSMLAGTVFTVSLPILTWQLVLLIVSLPHGMEDRNWIVSGQGASVLFTLVLLAQWFAGTLWCYRAFLGLEVAGSRELAIRFPGGFPRKAATRIAPARKASAWLRLVGKELRLLSPAFLVAGIYLALTGVDLLRRLWRTDGTADAGEFLGVATLIYGALVSVLVGSLACAEDRHAGTLQWHLVQPIGASSQWMIKVGVALGTALVLAAGLPLIMLGMEAATGLSNRFGLFPPAGTLGAAVQVLGLCTVGLYASSVAPTAIRAMLWAAPIGLVLETLAWGLIDSPETRSWFWNSLVPFATEGNSLNSAAGAVWVLFWSLLGAGLFATPLACAYFNFRSLEPKVSRVVIHLAVMVLYGLLAGTAAAAFKQGTVNWGLTLPARERTEAEAQVARCADNVSAIEAAVNLWAKTHGQLPAPGFASLTNELQWPGVLICPSDQERQPANDWSSWEPGTVTYAYTTQTNLPPASGWNVEIRCPIHGTKGTAGSAVVRPMMDARMLIRYGLSPRTNRNR